MTAEMLPIDEFGVQVCKRCERKLPLSQFSPNKDMRLGVLKTYKRCNSEKAMEWADRNYDRVFEAHLRRQFGITTEQYEEMVAAQGGVCAICGTPPVLHRARKGGRRQGRQVSPRLVVDHDHCTGTVRGLLCVRCNRGIGFLKDNPAILRSALEYLER